MGPPPRSTCRGWREPRGSNLFPRPRARRAGQCRGPSPGEVVLMVEDDEDVLDSTAGLAARAWAIRSCPRATVPKRWRSSRRSERVDILFTDVVLPQGMNGRTLAIEAAALRPALPVLFTTGYARNAIIHNGQLDADVQFLAKPYTQQDIAQKLRAVIDAAAKA